MSDSEQHFHWWQTGVIYQIYPRSFKDSNGDGVGDLQGIIDKLDYLNDGTPNSLGVNAIWISPIYPSPMADFGYDVSNYVDIHPLFGDLPTFDRLLAEAHHRGIKVILDYVPNHTSDLHPWFIESRSSRETPRRDWYIWRDAKPDGGRPNNWASMFGGPAWEWDEKTRQYYLHLFLSQQPDLNWRNPAVRGAMMDVLRFWLDRGVDGFRMDVVGFIMKDKELRDDPVLDESKPHTDEWWGALDHVYDIDQPEAHDRLREFRALIDTYKDRVMIGEIWATPRAKWASYFGTNQDELHLPFNFDLLHKPWDAHIMRSSVDELEAVLPPGAWPNYVLGSHDVARLASRYGEKAARVAAMMLLTLRGTPTLYYGDELGMENGVIAPERLQDPQGINLGADRSRDVARTPMLWDRSPYAGFSTVEPWLPVNDSYPTRNVAMQTADATSILSLYRHLLHHRAQTPALNRGSYRALGDIPAGCFVYVREYQNDCCLIGLNFGDVPCDLSLEAAAPSGEVVISTELDRSGVESLTSFHLRPHEGVILKI